MGHGARLRVCLFSLYLQLSEHWKIPIFEGLRRKELAAVERILYRREYKAGEIVLNQGDPAAGMYIIEKGKVQVVFEPTQQVIAELYDGDNTRQISQAYTVSSSNTWEKNVLSFAGDTTGALDDDNANSLILNLWLGAGSDYTSGTLNTSWGSVTTANRAVAVCLRARLGS